MEEGRKSDLCIFNSLVLLIMLIIVIC